MSKYPKCFPENFEKDILPKDAKYEKQDVYRVMKSGKIERENFMSTYEEVILGKRPRGKKWNEKDPETYSTSCSNEYDDIMYTLSFLMRHHPKAIVAKGITEPECGPSKITIEGKPHVGWWIYEQAEPQRYFEEVEINDE